MIQPWEMVKKCESAVPAARGYEQEPEVCARLSKDR